MLEARKRPQFRKQLLSWFRQFQRDLPWRRDRDPYRIWISEIMLQQTRVAAVLPYYERFLERFPTIPALAAAPEEEVLTHWSGLGYYSRARNLQSAAQRIVANHSGEFPSDHAEVLALPGIGPYTSAAILSMAFNAPHAVLDGNVARVVARLDAVRGDLRKTKTWSCLQRSADALLDPGSPSDWNQAVMELGAMICTPTSPQCLICPVAKFCKALQLGLTDVIPEKRKKRASVSVTLAAAILTDSKNCTLLFRAPAQPETSDGVSPGKERWRATPPTSKRELGATKTSLASSAVDRLEVEALVSKMWHFPTISVKSNATAELRAYLSGLLGGSGAGRRRNGGKPMVLEALAGARHTVTYRDIRLLPFRVRVAKLPRIAGARIVPIAEVASHSSLAVSNLTRKFARAALADVTLRPRDERG
jgi:A/G-specific adenine glycosylase